MIELNIYMDDKTGKFNVDAKDIPLFLAIGMLEAAKDVLLHGDIEPEEEGEAITKEDVQ